jgi:hypothetical protein
MPQTPLMSADPIQTDGLQTWSHPLSTTLSQGVWGQLPDSHLSADDCKEFSENEIIRIEHAVYSM